MKSRRWTFFTCIFIILFLVECVHIVYQPVLHKIHYPTLIGSYCFDPPSSSDYKQNQYINDSFYIQLCSFTNIYACQHIQNQTFLFRLNWYAGFTSELNNLVRAFTYAIHTRRKFMVDDQVWNYGSFAAIFNVSQAHFSPWLPSSPYCSQRQFIHLLNYQENNTKQTPAHLTTARGPNGGYTHLSLQMRSLESDSQIIATRRLVVDYLWKTLTNETRHFIDQHLNEIELDTIIYGMHIRRGDKVTEVKSSSTSDYIAGVESFMKREPQTNSNIRVYVASDESNVINELQELKPNWKFIQISSSTKQSRGHQQGSFNRLPASVKLESGRFC
ncbi:hypothetical protein I4U23_029791 [Adineta vaga]|nr:hypothetical protein I4U23_029791 [Adineta vaga]